MNINSIFSDKKKLMVLCIVGVVSLSVIMGIMSIYADWVEDRRNKKYIASLQNELNKSEKIIEVLSSKDSTCNGSDINGKNESNPSGGESNPSGGESNPSGGNDPGINDPSVKKFCPGASIIDVSYTGTPIKKSMPTIFKPSGSFKVINETYYKVGTVKSGSYNGIDFSGWDVYFLYAYVENPEVAYAIGGEYSVMGSLLKKNSSNFVYFIYNDTDLDEYLLNNVVRVKKDELSIKQDYDPVLNFFPNKDVCYGSTRQTVHKSEKGVNYSYGGLVVDLLSLNSLKKVDTIDGQPVYILKSGDEGVSYLISEHGFYYKLYINTPSDKSDFSDRIMYIDSISGYCNKDTVIDIENISDPSKLVAVTMDNSGNSVKGYYAYKDTQDELRRKIYYQDYVASEWYKYNDLKIDDTGPISYDDYLKYNPVVYWKDPYGRYIRLVNTNFLVVGGCAKPAVYMYSEKIVDVTVKVIPNGRLTFTYPAYNGAWNVTVFPGGKIVNNSDGKSYDYLWWESNANNFDVPRRGFLVKKGDVEAFLDEKLTQFGLNDKEIKDFKEYWLQKLGEESGEYLYITFLIDDQVNIIAKLEYSVDIDTEMRIFMLYKSVESKEIYKYKNIPEQDIKYHERKGFTVVEWGGGKMDD